MSALDQLLKIFITNTSKAKINIGCWLLVVVVGKPKVEMQSVCFFRATIPQQ